LEEIFEPVHPRFKLHGKDLILLAMPCVLQSRSCRGAVNNASSYLRT